MRDLGGQLGGQQIPSRQDIRVSMRSVLILLYVLSFGFSHGCKNQGLVSQSDIVLKSDDKFKPQGPEKLSSTFLFQDMNNLMIRSQFVPYEVNLPFWSDGAQKKRWYYIPPTAKIKYNDNGGWKFPDGTIFVKHFSMMFGNVLGTRNLETRILQKKEGRWVAFQYKWDSSQTEAYLSTKLTKEAMVVNNVKGIQEKFVYEYPSNYQCHSCHSDYSGPILGFITPQLKNTGTLADLFRAKKLLNSPSSLDDLPEYSALTDASVSLETRSQQYMQVNCGYCHYPSNDSGSEVVLNYEADYSKLANAEAIMGDLDQGLEYIIVPGSKEQSVLWARMNDLDMFRMPFTGSKRLDHEALEVIGQWIDSMPAN